MAKYVALLSGKKSHTLTEELLSAHVEHLRVQQSAGYLILCGPFRDNDGALQILETESREHAEAILKSDPFIAQRYYERYALSELIEANEANGWLMRDGQTRDNLGRR
ncbi:YciI family protein [Niveibacterium terrae]|uniref:YciI family protein n=1 Tax=Niveibacterium terrae TaxID=3373598 RepID=UPI003A9336C4